MAILIVRDGNRLLLGADSGSQFPEALPAVERRLLVEELSYVELNFLRGKEYYDAKRMGLPTVQPVHWNCHAFDLKQRMCTSFGFLHRIKRLLEKNGVKWRLVQLTKHPHPEIFEPQWDRIYDEEIVFRHRQEELLCKIFANENGCFMMPPGFGKSKLVSLAAKALPKAKIAVAVRPVPVLLTRIYPELCSMLPNVGIVGGGRNQRGHRVMCYTLASLHHCPEDIDMLFVDEAHQAAPDDSARVLGKFKHTRMYALSATFDMRLDNKDMRLEAIFGPMRMVVTYKEAEEQNMVVPLEVRWRNVVMAESPCVDHTGVAKKRYGIWRNEYRNSLIAADARRHPGCQVLVTCEVIEHVLALQKLLPEALTVYNENGMQPDDFAYFDNHGLIPDNFRMMTAELKQQRIEQLVNGKPGIYVANTVLNVGVDCKYLSVVCRADAGGSPINDTQLPGRASRINAHGKTVGIIYDYLDQFDTFKYKARGRYESYDNNDWQQILPDNSMLAWLREPIDKTKTA